MWNNRDSLWDAENLGTSDGLTEATHIFTAEATSRDGAQYLSCDVRSSHHARSSRYVPLSFLSALSCVAYWSRVSLWSCTFLLISNNNWILLQFTSLVICYGRVKSGLRWVCPYVAAVVVVSCVSGPRCTCCAKSKLFTIRLATSIILRKSWNFFFQREIVRLYIIITHFSFSMSVNPALWSITSQIDVSLLKFRWILLGESTWRKLIFFMIYRYIINTNLLNKIE